jgi:hypothetical protein
MHIAFSEEHSANADFPRIETRLTESNVTAEMYLQCAQQDCSRRSIEFENRTFPQTAKVPTTVAPS